MRVGHRHGMLHVPRVGVQQGAWVVRQRELLHELRDHLRLRAVAVVLQFQEARGVPVREAELPDVPRQPRAQRDGAVVQGAVQIE